MSKERWLSRTRPAILAGAAALALGACSDGGSVHERAPAANAGVAGVAPGTASTGGSAAQSGESGSAGQSPAASGSAGTAAPAAGNETPECVNGIRASGDSSLEGGGTAPDIPVSAVHSAIPVPPLSGGTLQVLGDGAAIAVSDPDRDRVYLVDVKSGAVRTVALNPGDEPGRLVDDGAGRVHVVLRRGDAIASIDTRLGAVSERLRVCRAPRGLAYEKATAELHVACAGGEVVSLTRAGAVTRTVRVERDLRDVVVQDDGTLLVSTFRKAEVLVLGKDGTVASRLQPGSGPVATLGGALRRTPSVAWRMVSFDAARGSVLLLHQTGVADRVDTGPAGYVPDLCGAVVQPGLSLLTPGAPSPAVATGLAHLPLVIDAAVSPDRRKVALAVAGNGTAQGETLVEAALDVAMPATPAGCTKALESEIRTPLPPGQVVAVSYAPSGVLFAQTREPAGLWRSDTGVVTSLARDMRPDTGHLVFHANSGGGITCASCHPEGGEDGRVWDLVCAGRRRTQSVRGGIGPTAPFHWDGSELDMARLLDDVFTRRMVGPLLSDEAKQAFRAWVDTLADLPKVDALDPASVARGRTLFERADVGCATCHAGSSFTNNATVDVGTGRALQVPSLRGLAWRAPFMHDGCAATLRDRFGSAACGGGDEHGVTSALKPNELDDLVTYLESL
jgi:hypothetical protein